MALVDDGGVAAAEAAEPPVQNYQTVIDLFPQLDLKATLLQFPTMDLDALVEFILVNEATIPKKRRGQKRALDAPPHKLADESAEAEDLSDNEDLDGEDNLLVSVMVKDMLNHLHRELQGANATPQARNEMGVLVPWLKITFRGAKASFITRIPKAFKYQAMSCGIACFLAENKFGYRLQIHAPDISQRFWMNDAQAMKVKRRVTPQDLEEAATRRPNGANKFDELMAAMKTKYPKLFAGDQLSPDARHLKAEKEEKKMDEEQMDCIVCFETYAVSKMLSCNPPTAGRTPSRDPNAPSSSAAAAAAVANDGSAHTFCRACLRQHAKAACEDMPMADGGVGLKCLEHGCKNPVLFSEIRHLLQKEVRKRLDERVLEENLGLAGFNNLERCPRCNFAMVIDVPKEVDKVFSCQNTDCEYQFCRLCEQPWGDDHFGVSCEKLNNKDKEQRELEKKLTEIVLRKCPKCGLTFLKETGCNKMTCRCGVKQCYVCRKSPIEYDHFCAHIRDPNSKQTKCTHCTKTCLLWEDASKKDEEKIREVLNGREEPLKDIPAASVANEHLAAAQRRRQVPQAPMPRPQAAARIPNPFAFNVPPLHVMPRVAPPAVAVAQYAAGHLHVEHRAHAAGLHRAEAAPRAQPAPAPAFNFNRQPLPYEARHVAAPPHVMQRVAQPVVAIPQRAAGQHPHRAPQEGLHRAVAAPHAQPAPAVNFNLQPPPYEARHVAAAPRH